MTKICPFLTAGAWADIDLEEFTDCQEDKCALWNDHMHECGLIQR